MSNADRFAFGENWMEFLSVLDDQRISQAERSLVEALGRPRLDGLRFCDVGSGSGLFSLAARRLGAEVISFDFDPTSVACTAELRRRYFPEDASWRIEHGSALDRHYLQGLGRFDIVYAWGVLHHTGQMWQAMELVADLVRPGGVLWVALYNDQGWRSRAWRQVKRAYNAAPKSLRFLIVAPVFVRLWGPTTLRDLARGRPFATWLHYRSSRGMSARHDLIDWVGGFPFEVARPEKVITFYVQLGFELRELVRRGGIGCNEFVFSRTATATAD